MLRRAFLTLFCLLFSASVFGAPEVLHLGIAPFNSPVGLLKTHSDLQKHLEERTGHSVRILTSANHHSFLTDSLSDKFDIIITPPHYGVICMERGFTPLVKYRNPLDWLFAVRVDSNIKTIADLRGKRIAFPDNDSLFSVAGIEKLKGRGLRAKRDYQALDSPGFAQAIISVVMGDADAALTPTAPFNQVSASARARTRLVLLDNSYSPHLMTLALTQLGDELTAKIKAALDSFPATNAGKAFFQSTGYGGYAPITDEDIKMMRPYADLIRPSLLPSSAP